MFVFGTTEFPSMCRSMCLLVWQEVIGRPFSFECTIQYAAWDDVLARVDVLAFFLYLIMWKKEPSRQSREGGGRRLRWPVVSCVYQKAENWTGVYVLKTRGSFPLVKSLFIPRVARRMTPRTVVLPVCIR